MKRKTKKLTEEDITLFREAVAGTQQIRQTKVTPFRERHRINPIHHSHPYPHHEQPTWQQDTLSYASIEHLVIEREFKRDGVKNQTLKRLKRGQFKPQRTLDLHGYNQQQAQNLLALFIRQCLTDNITCIRIIHGKGLNSPQHRSVLKSVVNYWLKQSSEVLAFSSPENHANDFGSLHILLKNPKNQIDFYPDD